MNILIVDDHAVVRQGYSALLTMMLPDAVVSEAENAQQTLKALAATDIDLVILDINLENASGLNLAGRLLKRWPRLKIIFFSMFDEPSVVNRAIQTGAKGYLSKRSKPEVMVEAIKAYSMVSAISNTTLLFNWPPTSSTMQMTVASNSPNASLMCF